MSPEPQQSEPLEPAQSARPLTFGRILFAALKVLLVVVILYFLFRQVADNWQAIREYDWEIHPLYLALSVVSGVGAFFIMSSVWRVIVGAFGYTVGPLSAFRIFYLANLGHYIPGRVWQVFGVLYLARQKGIPPEPAAASFVMVQLFAIPASFLIYALAAYFEPKLLVEQVALLGQGASYVLTGAMIVLCLLITLFPQVFLGIGNRVLRFLKRPTIEFRLDKKVALGVFIGYGIGWICYGLAFWLFVKTVAPEADLSAVAGIGAFNAAYQIGYLVLFAPGGFGPREFVMGVLLAPFVGPIGAAVAITARIWAVLIESLAALMALAVRK